MDKAKPFNIPKREVWEAYKRVRANQGAAGVDGYKFCLITGQRLNEVARMPWSEINDDIWVLPDDRTKNKRVHVVPLSQMASEIGDVPVDVEKLR